MHVEGISMSKKHKKENGQYFHFNKRCITFKIPKWNHIPLHVVNVI